MEDYNSNITDKEIRELLKRRLIEQGEDDLLTQKLMDMEAKLAFSNEALLVPSLKKEKELLQKLTAAKSSGIKLKWILSGFLAALVVAGVLYYNHSLLNNSASSAKVNEEPPQKNLAAIQTLNIEASDSTRTKEITIDKNSPKEKIITREAVKENVAEKLPPADAKPKEDYKEEPVNQKTKFNDAPLSIPVLCEKEKEYTKKMKEKLIKNLIKLNKDAWAFIPSSTEIIYGETVSVQGFYMSSFEVSNNNYRLFLNDLIMQNRIDDFFKAVPDTAKLIINGKSFYEPIKNLYLHPAYGERPAVNITRDGAQMYCTWLTQAVNEKIKAIYPKEKWESLFINDMRIPAEEEWMIAARGGLGDVSYPWSSSLLKGVQNARGCYLCNFSIINYPDSLKKRSECNFAKTPNAITSAGSVTDDYYFTAPCFSYNPNIYGLFCMSGNAAEMVLQFKTKKLCAKGGSWNSDPDQVKITAGPELINVISGSPYLGFRPVFTAKISDKRRVSK